MSTYFFRIRSPQGLENCLLKELKTLKIAVNAQKEKGRPFIDVQCDQQTFWKIMYKSRITERIQLRMTKPFIVRGDKELDQRLQKLPWTAFLPIKNFNDYKMPQTTCKSFKSKLFHTKMVREKLLRHVNELPIQYAFNQQKVSIGQKYKNFKKDWIQKYQKEQREEIEQIVEEKLTIKKEKQKKQKLIEEGKKEEVEAVVEQSKQKQKKQMIKGLTQLRMELQEKAKKQRNLKQLSKITISLNKDRAEILLDTSTDDLHKHGQKPFVRWGIMKESTVAACIMESGILEKALKTEKLYLWDPFCGSGSFLIEALMMLLEQPIRRIEETLPFENWPIHQKEQYEKFKDEINEIKNMQRKDNIDVQLIGSDISLKAIKTSMKNIEYAELDMLAQNLLTIKDHKFINSPLIFNQHYPRYFYQEDGKHSEIKSIVNYKDNNKNLYCSLYHGDFSNIGHSLATITDQFKDFTILTNVPYGQQSLEKQWQKEEDVQKLYRRLGRFLQEYPNLDRNTFIVAQSTHYGHKMSFEKYSNSGWDKLLHFKSGGISVNLLKLDKSKISKTKQTIEAYKQISASSN